jgi:hypothetical protein
MARLERAAITLLGLVLAISGLGAPFLRSAYGFPGVNAHVFVVAGLGLLLLSAAWRTRWQRPVTLLWLALMGQACALQLIAAPPYSVYQHFASWPDILSARRAPFLLGISAQTAIVLRIAAPAWPAIRRGAADLFRGWRAALFLIVFAFGAAVFSAHPFHFAWEVFLTAWVGVSGLVTLMLAVRAVPAAAADHIARYVQSLSAPQSARMQRMSRLIPWLAAGWTVLVAAFLAWVVFDAVPHIPDDVSYLFQAKYFAAGRLYLPAPPDAASFQVGQVAVDGDKWFGYGFPGWPAVLALGVVAGAPWLINPVLAGIAILLVHALVTRIYSRAAAHGVVALLAVSPWFLYMSASFMTHTATAVWTLVALLALEKERATGRAYWGLLGGAALGALFLTRPLEGILVGGALGLWALGLLGRARLRVPGLAAMVSATLIVGSLIFPYNRALTGNATYPAHLKWTDQTWYPGADRLGFGPNIGNVGWPHLDPLPGHGPVDVVINANRNLYMANVELFGWSFGSLSLALLAVVAWRLRREDRVFAAIALATMLGHSFYWFSGGPDLGARYWYQTLIPLVILTVRGVHGLQERLARAHPGSALSQRVLLFVAMACLVAFPNVMTWRSFGKYHRYRGMSADVRNLARDHHFGRSLVFVRAPENEDYAGAFILNSPTLDGAGPIYVRDLGPEQRAALRRAFPDRAVWTVGYQTRESVRMQVLSGPTP